MSAFPQRTILCITSYEKGQAFMRQAKQEGSTVYLLTVEKLREADWPRDHLDEIFFMPSLFNEQDMIYAVSYVARTRPLDRIVALDDYDVEMAAALREHLRIPGMGDTTARYFRDKLAMRVRAKDRGVRVPEFVHVLNYDRIRDFMWRVPPAWVLKPRSEASSLGIKKINSADEFWPAIETLGDRQSYYVLEQYIPGNVFHVDSIVSEKEVVFAEVHGYAKPPFDVMHGGGIFVTRTLPRESGDVQALRALNQQLLEALGFVRGVTHAEFIKGQDDGQFYFLECAARVGGANIVELVEASTGLNLWAEWARIEIGGEDVPYELPPHRSDYGGLIISLARQEWPDMSAYADPEIAWRMKRKNHAGLVVCADNPRRVQDLLDSYVPRFYNDFHTTLPAPDKPSN
ncbi:MAG: ATP-grasp domain-containing protein [Chloroflexi bacterium]|nr:ATP-grasp domain-containing protein [Chloroflexota bacterium]